MLGSVGRKPTPAELVLAVDYLDEQDLPDDQIVAEVGVPLRRVRDLLATETPSVSKTA